MKKLKDVMRKGVAPKSTFGTNPLDPWSTKSNITEGRTSLLNKFILSKGIEPSSLSTDSMIAYSKTLEFAKWTRDRKMRGESVESLLDETYPGHSSTEKNPNFNDELSNRRVSPIGKRLKSGKLDYAERSSQDRLKRLMKFTKTKGGLAGPKGNLPEAVDRKDTVTINIPLMIRLLELAREDVKTDMELHHIVERLINIRGRGVLGMDHYNYIAGKSRKVFREETDLDDYDTIVKESAGNYTVHTTTGKHTVYGPSDDHAEMTKHLHRQMGGHGKIIYGEIKKIEPYTGSVANTRDPKSNRSYNESINKMFNEDDPCLDEMAGANMDTRAVHQHLKKAGWNLTRTTGSHDVFTHKNSKEHIPVPRHRQLKAPLVQSILKTSKMIMDDVELGEMDNRTPSGDRRERRAYGPEAITQREKETQSQLKKVSPELRKKLRLPEPKEGMSEDKYQDPQAATQTVGMEVESKKRFKSLRPAKNVKEDMYDTEKEDKSVQTYGKKPKFKKTDDMNNDGNDEVTARSTLSGGKTMTGQNRDTVEIDPSMRKRLDPTGAVGSRKTTEKK
jgi:predicted RNA binding protein YcfA (HicA-like mRNA interferase family)